MIFDILEKINMKYHVGSGIRYTKQRDQSIHQT